MLKKFGLKKDSGVNVTVVNVEATEREAISDAYAGVAQEDQCSWLIMHCHVATHVR